MREMPCREGNQTNTKGHAKRTKRTERHGGIGEVEVDRGHGHLSQAAPELLKQVEIETPCSVRPRDMEVQEQLR